MEIKNKCVYVFLDHRKIGNYEYDNYKFQYEPIYIGKGSKYRISNHKSLYNKKDTLFYKKYNEILSDTSEHPPHLIIKDNLTEYESIQLEKYLINIIGRINTNNGPLTNEKSEGFIYTSDLYKLKNIFIEKSNKIYNFFYNYDKSNYINNKTKIDIICPIHGVFEQRPDDHLNGHKCPKCSNNYRYTIDDIIKISNDIHEYKYNYSLVKYKNNKTKFKIICSIHGIFEQNVIQHILRKDGCPKCSKNYKSNTQDFIKKSNNIHNYKYKYYDEYINSNTKFNIFCPILEHGYFKQTPHDHLSGRGCPKCGKSKK